MKQLLLLLVPAIILLANDYKYSDTTQSITSNTNIEYSKQVIRQNIDKPTVYYPTQTAPAPNVMYDYRTPSYDIYHYDLAPVD